MSLITWLLPNTVTSQYMRVVSDYAIDKAKWWERYQWIAKKWYVNSEFTATIWCIDEKFLKNEFYTIFWVIEEWKYRMVAMIKGTASKHIIRKLVRWMTRKQRELFVQISADMANSMHCIVREVFPNALIVDDRFHVQKQINWDVQAIRMRLKTICRKQEVKSDRKELKRYTNWETRCELLTRVMYQLSRPIKARSDSQIARWNVIKSISSFKVLVVGYDIAIELHNTYEQCRSKIEWENRINKLITKAKKYRRVAEVLLMARLLEKRLDTITNYFISRHTNWRAENLNMRISDIVRDCRWFSNPDYMVFRLSKALW